MSQRRKLHSSSAWFHSLILVFALLFTAGTAGAQIRTVLVSPVPGNPTASGTALQTALTGIASPSSTNRWLLKIEPGIYDVGTTPLQMRSWVDIEGSGIGVTTIRGSVATNRDGTVHGADDAELRLLTVEAVDSPEAIAMVNVSVSPRLYRVRFIASASGSGSVAWGIRSLSGAPLIEECEVTVTSTGGANAYGLLFRNLFSGILPAGRTLIRSSRIMASGATLNYGVYMSGAQIVQEIRDSRIDAVGGTASYGIHALTDPTSFWTGEETLQIRNTEILASGGSSASYGIEVADSNAYVGLEVNESKVWGTGSGTTYGILQAGEEAPVTVQGSWVIGFTRTIDSVNSASITATTLQGGSVLPANTAALTQEFDVMGHGDVGIGTAAPTEKLHVYENANANSLLVVENPNTGASAAGVLRSKSDNALINLIAHGSGRTISRFGQTLGSWSELLQVNGNGLILGTATGVPLILGTNSVNRFHITGTGSIGVGTSSPSSLFHVSGGDIRVSGGSFIDDGVTLNTPDYVFEPDYSLRSLPELKEFIEREKHLPNIPSAAEVKANGVKLGQFQMLLLEKVEELTLYTLDQDEELRRLRAEKAELEKQLGDRLAALERALGVSGTSETPQ